MRSGAHGDEAPARLHLTMLDIPLSPATLAAMKLSALTPEQLRKAADVQENILELEINSMNSSAPRRLRLSLPLRSHGSAEEGQEEEEEGQRGGSRKNECCCEGKMGRKEERSTIQSEPGNRTPKAEAAEENQRRRQKGYVAGRQEEMGKSEGRRKNEAVNVLCRGARLAMECCACCFSIRPLPSLSTLNLPHAPVSDHFQSDQRR